MKILVKLFGMLRQDRFKQRYFDFPDGTRASDILDQLSISREELKVSIVCVNGRRSELDTVLKSGDILEAFLPFGEG